jgi:hypothetical protein
MAFESVHLEGRSIGTLMGSESETTCDLHRNEQENNVTVRIALLVADKSIRLNNQAIMEPHEVASKHKITVARNHLLQRNPKPTAS